LLKQNAKPTRMQPSTKTIRCVIRQLDSFLFGAEPSHGKNRPKDLVMVYQRKNCREGARTRRATYLIPDLSCVSGRDQAIFVGRCREAIGLFTHNFHVLFNVGENFPKRVSTTDEPRLSNLVWETLTCGIYKITPARAPFSADQDFGSFLFARLDISPHLIKLNF